MRLFAGDDWAEDHHDVEVMDAAGRVLARARLPEGVAGMTRLHELTGQYLGEDAEEAEVLAGIAHPRIHFRKGHAPFRFCVPEFGVALAKHPPKAYTRLQNASRSVRQYAQ